MIHLDTNYLIGLLVRGSSPAAATGAAESQISNPKSQIQTGRPYFVMELVRGIRITDFCQDAERLVLKQRLRNNDTPVTVEASEA